ncbi:CHASE3 domain-containing protein [Streptomyces sp. NBC_00859]|uniref:sensor histidine kinase n=1 Tax=Streptomyces sp. NBC_00859 TaxID=2903682 RepID=UPI003865A65A|nr:CHASE3 domain-containing protein [Streptomyces sp. NBC_00859]
MSSQVISGTAGDGGIPPEDAAESGSPADTVVPTARPGLRSRLSVQNWVHLILAGFVVVVCGCTAVGGVFLSRTNDRTTALVDRIQPARSASFQLQKALLDQETGARGYALSGDTSFLEPYEQGRRDEQRYRAGVEAFTGSGSPYAQDLDRIRLAAEKWRSEQAEPLIATVRAKGRGGASEARIGRSKSAFDGLRADMAVQQRHIEAAQTRARAGLDASRHTQNQVLIALLAAFALVVIVLSLLLHRIVGRPLNALRVSSDTVRGGDFHRRIEVRGPSDVRAVGAAVEDMRRRLADELAESLERETLLAGQADELRRSNSELEQFAYVASHDLQEPLRKVASFCQLLEKRYAEVLDDRGKQYIDFAVDGAKRMQVLINDLLTFSRVGRVLDSRRTVCLDSSLDRALANLAFATEETGAAVVRTDPLPEVTGDPTALVMLWQNLIGNAVKFRRAGHPCVVTVGCTGDGDTWHMTVSDNGIGVAPEFAEKIFVIFQRLHARDEYDGTGIGLALCRKIVEFHGGRIWLDESMTEGARIHFTLPVRSGADAAGPVAVAAEHPTTAQEATA